MTVHRPADGLPTDVVLVHDYLNQRGGAERVVLELAAMFPQAPLYTSLYRSGSTPSWSSRAPAAGPISCGPRPAPSMPCTATTRRAGSTASTWGAQPRSARSPRSHVRSGASTGARRSGPISTSRSATPCATASGATTVAAHMTSPSPSYVLTAEGTASHPLESA